MPELVPQAQRVSFTDVEVLGMHGICKAAAKALQNRSWDKLDSYTQHVADLLEKEGYLIPNNPQNGFTGKINPNKGVVNER